METKELPNGYLPKEQRKKIFLLADDLRVNSGIGTISKELVLGTCHRFNFFQLGASLNHPQAGQLVNGDEEFSKLAGIPDASVQLLPYNGYGDMGVVRWVLEREKPDAIMLFTDPRYWIWLFQMEHEIRQVCPIVYLSLWDDLPIPQYNKPYYDSCDALLGISKQSHYIHKALSDNYELLDFENRTVA